MVVFKEARAGGISAEDYNVDLDYLSKAKEGQLLDALDLIFEILCCTDRSAEDAPDSIPGAILILARLRDIRNKAFGSTFNQSRYDKQNWGYSDDSTTMIG